MTTPPRGAPTHSWRRGLLLVAATLPAAACDIPTRVPLVDTEWEAVVLTDTITTTELLPDGMRVTEAGFVLDSFTTTSEVRLGEVCEVCTCFEGPIPPIELAPRDWEVRLPPGLAEAPLDGGAARLVLHNEVGFDVLDDGEGGKGWLLVELVDIRTGAGLDTVRVGGSFPPGDSLVVEFDLEGIVLSPFLVARMSGRTPGSGCHDVDVTPDLGFRADVALRDVLAPWVRVDLSDAAVTPAGRDIDLPGFVADRLRPGDAEVVVDVSLASRLPTAVDLSLSAAPTPGSLFTGAAALYTPLLLPAGGDEPVVVRKEFVVDVAALEGADRLYIASRGRVAGDRRVELRGGEGIEYRVTLRARIPSR